MRSSLVNRFNFLERKQKLRGAKCVLLITLLKFLADSFFSSFTLVKKIISGRSLPNDLLFRISGGKIQQPDYATTLHEKKRKKKKTFEESGSYFLFNDVHQQALA